MNTPVAPNTIVSGFPTTMSSSSHRHPASANNNRQQPSQRRFRSSSTPNSTINATVTPNTPVAKATLDAHMALIGDRIREELDFNPPNCQTLVNEIWEFINSYFDTLTTEETAEEETVTVLDNLPAPTPSNNNFQSALANAHQPVFTPTTIPNHHHHVAHPSTPTPAASIQPGNTHYLPDGTTTTRTLIPPYVPKTCNVTHEGSLRFARDTQYPLATIAPIDKCPNIQAQPRHLLHTLAIALGLKDASEQVGFPGVSLATSTTDLISHLAALAPPNVVVRSAQSTRNLVDTLCDRDDEALPMVPTPHGANVQLLAFSIRNVDRDPPGFPASLTFHVGYITNHLIPAHDQRHAVAIGTTNRKGLEDTTVAWEPILRAHCFKFSPVRASMGRMVHHKSTHYIWLEPRR